ncbi:cln5-like protein 1 isoform X1 [Amphiura filiformis]|uniref:cln5-like protein 1 isoform X1 n=1 Tax=Amphiura filiformis TaxID=82378 RepID=UPI003B217DFF
MQCDHQSDWTKQFLPDGSGVVPGPIAVELYNTTEACSFNMTVRYEGACPRIGPSQPIKQPLSAGSILIIIFLVTAVVYLVGGAIMNKSGGATGLELIPNLEFWKSLPQLIAEGAVFFWSCLLCQGSGTEHSGYESI